MKKVTFTLRGLSIRNKIIAIVLLATIVPLVGGFAFVIVNERRAFRREMLDNAVVIARVTAENSVADLAFGDRASADNTLSKLSSIESVERVTLFDRDGKLFATWHRMGSGASQRYIGPARLWSEDHLQVSEPVSSAPVNMFRGFKTISFHLTSYSPLSRL